MADKHREIALVQTARKQYPWFPPGEIREYEKPEVLLVHGDDRIGIEVTELFQPPNQGSKFGPHVVAKFNRDVMEIADGRAQSLPPRDVLLYFWEGHHLHDAEAAPQALIDFVQAHPNGTYDMLDGIPYGFSVLRIADPIANEISRWRCLSTGETLTATREMIEKRIAEKNRLVPSYRRNDPPLSRVWLLIACSFADFANNFNVPEGIDTWRFDFDFDKVLLLSSESGVFNLLRRETN
jgi:hypothetical protein